MMITFGCEEGKVVNVAYSKWKSAACVKLLKYALKNNVLKLKDNNLEKARTMDDVRPTRII